MDRSRWILVTSFVALLALTAGCVADDVAYVDERGNELGVDQNGQLILPPEGTDGAGTWVPYVVEERVVQDDPPQPVKPPSGEVMRPAPSYSEATGTPKPNPDWDLPPAGVAAQPPLEGDPVKPKVGAATLRPPVEKQAPAKKKAKKKIDSSSNLDLPPAG